MVLTYLHKSLNVENFPSCDPRKRGEEGGGSVRGHFAGLEGPGGVLRQEEHVVSRSQSCPGDTLMPVRPWTRVLLDEYHSVIEAVTFRAICY